MFLVLAALVVAGSVLREEMELRRLRTAVAELSSSRSEAADLSSAVNPTSTEIEGPEASEVRRLRNEVTQLRREKIEMSALQAKMEELTTKISAMSGSASGPITVTDGFDRSISRLSPVVAQAVRLAQSSPEEAARFVAALPAGEEQNKAALAVIDHWVGADPAAAATWASQFPEGSLRVQAVSLAARQWGLRDCNATAGWLETLPTGSSRDAAIGAFVISADGYDIKLALEWANRTENSQSRASWVEGTARRWLHDDNSAARAWIEKAQLPTGMAERLLSGK
jgi:hypothetical protein